MIYTVTDEKGISYTDDRGRKTIEKGRTIDESFIEKGLFTRECLDSLVKKGRVKKKTKPERKAKVDSKVESDKTMSPDDKLLYSVDKK